MERLRPAAMSQAGDSECLAMMLERRQMFSPCFWGAQVSKATWHAMPLIRTTVRSAVTGIMNETCIPHLGDITNTPRWCSGKESTCRCLPWSGKIPWRRTWQPIPIFLPGKSQGQKKTGGYSPWDYKELDMTERLIRLLWPISNIPKVSKAHERCISTHTSSSPTSLLTFFDSWNQPTLLSLSVTSVPPDKNTDQKKKKKSHIIQSPFSSLCPWCWNSSVLHFYKVCTPDTVLHLHPEHVSGVQIALLLQPLDDRSQLSATLFLPAENFNSFSSSTILLFMPHLGYGV